MMVYVDYNKDTGKVTGVYHCQQYEGQPCVPEDDPAVVAYLAPKPSPLNPLEQLEQRIAEIEKHLGIGT